VQVCFSFYNASGNMPFNIMWAFGLVRARKLEHWTQRQTKKETSEMMLHTLLTWGIHDSFIKMRKCILERMKLRER
jgi:hypothetical protein